MYIQQFRDITRLQYIMMVYTNTHTYALYSSVQCIQCIHVLY